MKDFYYILGTACDATPTEIDSAYQKLARKFHQDGEEQDEFMDARLREIAEAYDILRDVRRRSKYDAAVKRNQNRQLAAFKLKYLNIAITLTFLVVTALFAGYVIRTLRGHEAKKTVQKVLTQPTVAAALTHPRKHHQPVLHAAKTPLIITHTTITPPQIVPATIPRPAADSTYTATLHANITGIVYLHQEPDYNSAILAKIPGATQVRILQKGPTYDKIMFNGRTGYVLKSCVKGQ